MRALPVPRYDPPQAPSPILAAVSGGIGAIESVASNWREQQRSIRSAMSMADSLEAEGMVEEARMYRAAAKNFQTNFFADPSANNKFRENLLSDSINLLKAKQTRELREKQIELQRDVLTNRVSHEDTMEGLAGRKVASSEKIAEARAISGPQAKVDTRERMNAETLLRDARGQSDKAQKHADNLLRARYDSVPTDTGDIMAKWSAIREGNAPDLNQYSSAAKSNLEKARSLLSKQELLTPDITTDFKIPDVSENDSFSSALGVAKRWQALPAGEKDKWYPEQSPSNGVWELKQKPQPSVTESTSTNERGEVDTRTTIRNIDSAVKGGGTFMKNAPKPKSMF